MDVPRKGEATPAKNRTAASLLPWRGVKGDWSIYQESMARSRVDSTAPANDAIQSALLALGGFAPPQTATTEAVAQASPTQQPAFTGSWTANLSNGARVQLLLQADGSFSWTAVNKDGQSSSFQGTYSMDNSSLSLSRSSDGQKLSGNLTNSDANKFSFKLSDAQASSLDFVRS